MILKLSVKSLYFDKLVSLCIIATLCCVIAPLMLLFSLRYGIISSLENDLKSSPLKLEIKMMTGYKLDENFINTVKNDKRVAFSLPLTRSLSATADINFNGKIKTSLSAIPTAKGDPIAKASNLDGVLGETDAYLSETLCNDLNMKVNDKFKVIISRIVDGQKQNSVVTFTLKGIIKKEYQSLKSIYINYDTMLYMEDFRDGYEPYVFSDGTNLNKDRKFFAKLRLYVKSLDDVESMAAFFRQKNYDIKACINEIEELKATSYVLSFIFYAVAITSIIGGILASAGLILTNLKRLDKSFALLKLDGMSVFNIMLIIIIQNLILAFVAYLLSYFLFFVGQNVFNSFFSKMLNEDTLVSVFTLSHFVEGLSLTLLSIFSVCLLLSLFRIKNLKVADTLREI